MSTMMNTIWRFRAGIGFLLTLVVTFSLATATHAFSPANLAVTRLSTDPYTNTSSQHQTEVEPDSFAFGSTIVMATQVGRFTDGGSSNVGWATSTNNGTSWSNGFLPGTTTFATPPGPFARVSDPSVAFDAKHNVWLIATLPINSAVNGAGVIVNRSTDGGLTWGNPVTVNSGLGTDKEWIVCDDTSTSLFYGNCYVEWDVNSNGNRIKMSTSTNGGLSWGSAKSTGNSATGIGGQPVVQPNGTVIVPIDNANETSLLAFRSTNGGSTWTSTSTITNITSFTDSGGIRAGPLPSAEIDGAGNVYVMWEDCRFRAGCAANDIVMTTSSNGTTWSAVTRVPIDATSSTVDHFLPGIGVDRTTSGSSAHLGLSYYYYPNANCTVSTCQLDIGFIASTNGGSSWGTPTMIAGPMNLSWIAATTQGPMVGDYMSTSFANGKAFPAIIIANAPSGGVFDEALYTVTGGL